jgi:hypothetical protein
MLTCEGHTIIRHEPIGLAVGRLLSMATAPGIGRFVILVVDNLTAQLKYERSADSGMSVRE